MNPFRLDEMPDVVTVEEARYILRIGRNSMYEAVRRGEIPGVIRLGRRLLIPRAALERLLKSGTSAVTTE